MQEHGIRINLFNISVRYVTVPPRQEDLRRVLHLVPDSEHRNGTESVCESLSPENVIFTIGANWVEEIVLSHVNHSTSVTDPLCL